jgi:hypothetical protein
LVHYLGLQLLLILQTLHQKHMVQLLPVLPAAVPAWGQHLLHHLE